MKAHVNKETCIGCGTCPLLAPNSFKMDDDGKAVEINPPGDDLATVKSAEEGCPVDAITVEE